MSNTESSIDSEMMLNPKSVDSGRQWTEAEEKYQEAVKKVAFLISLMESISTDQEKELASAQTFVKNYEESVRKIRNSISEKGAK